MIYTEKKSSGFGTGSTQPREYNWGATWQKSSGSCLENREYSRMDPSLWPRGTLYPQKLAIISPTSGGRSVGVVHSRTQTMEFVCFVCFTLSRRLSGHQSRCGFASKEGSSCPFLGSNPGHLVCIQSLLQLQQLGLRDFEFQLSRTFV
jgi:hypothetical protein